jgi:ABC-type branched-subunit amino acid transport system ATPase component
VRAVLAAEGISKAFAGNQAVIDVSLAVAPGEIVALVGPNGAGKTTLLNVLTGQHLPDRGRVDVCGVDVTRREPSHPSRRPLLRTYQDSGVFPRLTAAQNVMVPLVARGVAPREASRRAYVALAEFGLAPVADWRADRLSGGQRKLIDFARCLVLEPAIALLDEPTAGVNPALADAISAKIERRQRDGVAFLIVSHELPWVFAMCTRVICMAAGRVLAEGTPAEIADNPDVIEAYLA